MKSRYTIVLDNVSGQTRSKDIMKVRTRAIAFLQFGGFYGSVETHYHACVHRPGADWLPPPAHIRRSASILGRFSRLTC